MNTIKPKQTKTTISGCHNTQKDFTLQQKKKSLEIINTICFDTLFTYPQAGTWEILTTYLKKQFLLEGGQHWKRLPRQAVESPPLEVFRTQLGTST